MHGGVGNDLQIDALRAKRADLKQNCICLYIIKTGTMPTSHEVAKTMSVALFSFDWGHLFMTR